MSDLSKDEQPNLKFFAYSQAAGMEIFNTPEEAAFCAAENIREMREQAEKDGWWEADVEEICWGQISEVVQEFIPSLTEPHNVDYELVAAV